MTFFQDLRFACRMLVKNAGLTGVAVVALALGIGVNTTVFTLVNAVLLRGLPYEDPHRIMHLECNNLAEGDDSMEVSYPDFLDWKEQSRTFQGLAAFDSENVNLTDGDHFPERRLGSRITANTFSLIGQAPLLGSDFRQGDDQPGAEPVAIIGYSIWQNRYGGDPDIIGKVVQIDEAATVIVGVMPEGMRFPLSSDLWLPLIPTESRHNRSSRGLDVFGRLKDGVTRLQRDSPPACSLWRDRLRHSRSEGQPTRSCDRVADGVRGSRWASLP